MLIIPVLLARIPVNVVTSVALTVLVIRVANVVASLSARAVVKTVLALQRRAAVVHTR